LGSPLPEPFQIGFTHHAPIHHPNPLRFSVALLHRLDHFFHRRHTVPVDQTLTAEYPKSLKSPTRFREEFSGLQ